MHFKKTAKRFVAFMLALITVLSIPISAGAISYDGTGTSGGMLLASPQHQSVEGLLYAYIGKDRMSRCFAIKQHIITLFQNIVGSAPILFRETAYRQPQRSQNHPTPNCI